MIRYFTIFLVAIFLGLQWGFAQKIDSLSKFIIRSGDTLVVYGKNIQTVRIKSFPDSIDIQQFIAKIPNPIDTAFVLIIPPNVRNDLYTIRAKGYNNNWSRPKLFRTYNFNPAKVLKSAWGLNYIGELDVDSFPKNIVYLNGGEAFVYAIDVNGIPYGIGFNFFKQLSFPAGLKDVVDIRGGWYHGLALTKDGRVFAFGDTNFKETFVPSDVYDSVVYISAGGFHSSCLTESGRVLVWGGENNFSYYSDTVDFGQRNIPNNLGFVEQIAPRGSHVVALNNKGEVRAWGLNDEGQTNVPASLSGVSQISGGWKHSLANTKPNGKVIPWGEATFGALDTPTNLNQVIKIDGGDWHGLALKADGTIIQWGGNYNNSIYSYLSNVPSLKNVVDIAAGDYASYALYRVIDTIFISGNISNAGNFSSIIIADSTDSVKVSFNPKNNYQVDSILINNTVINKDSLKSYTFNNITSNKYIKIFFSIINDTIFISENIVGAGTFNSTIIAKANDTITVFYKPSSLKYRLDSILINDSTINYDSLQHFTFKNINANQKIKLFFSEIEDTIFVSANLPGQINFIPYYIVVRTANARVFYNPVYNYRIDSLILNDSIYIKDSLLSYTFNNVIGNQKFRIIISRVFTPPVITMPLDSQQEIYCTNTAVNIIQPLMIKVQAASDSTTFLNSKLVKFQWYINTKPDTVGGRAIPGAQGILSSFDTTLILVPQNYLFGIPYDSGAYYYVSVENNYDTQKLYSKLSGLILFKNITAQLIKIDTINIVSPRQAFVPVKISLSGADYYVISPALYAMPFKAISNEPIYLKPIESTLFKILGFDQYGCEVIDSIFIPVDSFEDIDIFPTKVITPNNDGINDYWVIHNIFYYPNNKIVIYNRLNHIVKSFVNFTSLTRWNATSQLNNVLPNGQYFYFIECYDPNQRIIKTKIGDFIIRRNE